MILNHLVVLESKDVLKKKNAGDLPKVHWHQPKRILNGQSWDNLRKNVNM